MSSTTELRNGDTKSHSSKKNLETGKIQELRVTLAEYDENCKKYIGATDEKLLSILRIKSFNVKNAARAIQTHENYKIKYSEIFSLPREEWKKAFEHDTVCVLKEKDLCGRRVAYFKLGNWDPYQLSLNAYAMGAFQLVDRILLNEDTQINGVSVIIDFKNVGFRQFAKQMSTIGVHELIRGNEVLKGGVIIKLKAIFFINAPYAFNQVMKAFKLILSKKFKDRMHFCNPGSEEFHLVFNKVKLPKSLGGFLSEEDGRE